MIKRTVLAHVLLPAITGRLAGIARGQVTRHPLAKTVHTRRTHRTRPIGATHPTYTPHPNVEERNSRRLYGHVWKVPCLAVWVRWLDGHSRRVAFDRPPYAQVRWSAVTVRRLGGHSRREPYDWAPFALRVA